MILRLPQLVAGRGVQADHRVLGTIDGVTTVYVGDHYEVEGATVRKYYAAGGARIAVREDGVLSWLLAESIARGKASALGAASGAVAGLVAITPACGFVGTMGGLVIGLVAGVAGFWGVNGIKRMLGADDSLDVFGVHGVCGIVGALLTGVFASPKLGGSGIWDYVANAASPDYSIGGQLVTQATGVLTTIVVSGVVSLIAFKLVDLTIGLRVTEEAEREGLDTTSHGEAAYKM